MSSKSEIRPPKSEMPMETPGFYIYILTNRARLILETGLTSDLRLKVNYAQTELTENRNSNHTKCVFLVYWELYDDPLEALNREKQLRDYTKKKKLELISGQNPGWRFLNEELGIGNSIANLENPIVWPGNPIANSENQIANLENQIANHENSIVDPLNAIVSTK